MAKEVVKIEGNSKRIESYPSGSNDVYDTEKAYDVTASWLKEAAENSDKPGVKFLEDRMLELEVELTDRLKGLTGLKLHVSLSEKPLIATATHKEPKSGDLNGLSSP
jgi:hypothetical protein